ncbi:TolC family protein [Bacteroidales bacterium OttesenSCG-928-L14]|nr:TolC family protein [Bacteroidales bacterium OttesenSCG-928-L14]
MNHIKNTTATIICLLFTNILLSQEMTLEQCREIALENNKKMAIAQKNQTKSDLTVKSTFTNFLPKLSASGMAYYTTSKFDHNLKIDDIQIFDPSPLRDYIPPIIYDFIDEKSKVVIPDMDFQFNMNNSYLVGANIDQPIYLGGKVRSGYKMSKIGSEIADINIRKTEAEIINETDKAYWLYVQTLELQKSANTYKETVAEFERVVKNAVDEGMKSRNDIMKVQVQLNQANLQLHRAQNGVNLARMNLCQVLGLPLETIITPTETLDDNLVEISYTLDISSRPEYEMLTKQVELKNVEQRFVQSDFLPTVGVRGAYNYAYGVKLNDEVLLNNGGFSAMLSVSVPIFHWGEGARKVQIAKAETDIVDLQREELNELMKLELQQAINQYNELLLEVSMTEIALEQAQENLRMSKDYYEEGLENISDYLEAQAIWQNAESEHIIAKSKLRIGRTEYLRTAGKLEK